MGLLVNQRRTGAPPDGRKTHQAKHIPDRLILEYLAKQEWSASWWEDNERMPSVADVVPKDFPYKVILAKMQSMIDRGLVDGCACGCRGSFTITKKGLDFLKEQSIVCVADT